MPNHTLQILRLLRFAGLMLLLGSVASLIQTRLATPSLEKPAQPVKPIRRKREPQRDVSGCETSRSH